jgi:hypothetical protein
MTTEEVKAKLAELGKKHGEALVKEVLLTVAFPLIDSKVAESETKIDDVVWGSIKAKAVEAVEQS